MQIRLYPHLSAVAGGMQRPVETTVPTPGRPKLPAAVSWLQPLPWDSTLRGQAVAAVAGRRLPYPLGVAALTASLVQAHLDPALVLLPVQHPLAEQLRRAGYVSTGRRRTYHLDLRARHRPLPRRAGLVVNAHTAAVPTEAMVTLVTQSAQYLSLADGAWPAHQAVHYLHRAVRGEAAFAVLTATVQGQLAGLVTLARQGAGAEIGVLAVAGAWRRQGVARLLLQAASRTALQAGLTHLVAHTDADNLPLCQLFAQASFHLHREELVFPLGHLRQQQAA